MARRRNAVASIVVPVKITLLPGMDDDLIELFNRLPPRLRATTIRAALRGQLATQAPETEADEDDAAFLKGFADGF